MVDEFVGWFNLLTLYHWVVNKFFASGTLMLDIEIESKRKIQTEAIHRDFWINYKMVYEIIVI